MLCVVAVEGDDRWIRLQQAWSASVSRARTDPDAYAGEVQDVLDDWPADNRTAAVSWVKKRLASGESPGAWRAVESSWLDLVLDIDDDPRADLVDTVWLDHQEFTAEQIRRLARRAPQIITLRLDEIDEDEEQLAGLFPGEAPWSRLRWLRIDSCEHNAALMPGLAMTDLPALKGLQVFAHWDSYKLAGASWLRTVERLELTYGSRSAWLASMEMPEVTELRIDARSSELSELSELADRTRKPKLRRIQIERLPEDYVLPSIPGVELVRR